MSRPRGSRSGHSRERKVKRLLEEEGWFVIRAAASLGFADLVALKAAFRPRMIEVKSTAGGPWERFGPDAREELRQVALRSGADAYLYFWPPGEKTPRVIPSSEWPPDRRMVA